MMNEDRYLVELRSLASLRDTAKATHHPEMMVKSLKVSVHQLAVMWQKFAIAKYPVHSDNYANKPRQIIQSQMTEDTCLINKFNEKRPCQRCKKSLSICGLLITTFRAWGVIYQKAGKDGQREEI